MFLLCSKLFIISGYKNRWELRWFPAPAACLWAVNPVHVQSVTYIVQRMTSMATMFYIASFTCYLTARRSSVKRTKTILL